MKNLTPMKSIRLKCLDCTCNQPREIRLCPIENCPLYPYRKGKRPKENNNETAHTAVEIEDMGVWKGGALLYETTKKE